MTCRALPGDTHQRRCNRCCRRRLGRCPMDPRRPLAQACTYRRSLPGCTTSRQPCRDRCSSDPGRKFPARHNLRCVSTAHPQRACRRFRRRRHWGPCTGRRCHTERCNGCRCTPGKGRSCAPREPGKFRSCTSQRRSRCSCWCRSVQRDKWFRCRTFGSRPRHRSGHCHRTTRAPDRCRSSLNR